MGNKEMNAKLIDTHYIWYDKSSVYIILNSKFKVIDNHRNPYNQSFWEESFWEWYIYNILTVRKDKDTYLDNKFIGFDTLTIEEAEKLYIPVYREYIRYYEPLILNSYLEKIKKMIEKEKSQILFANGLVYKVLIYKKSDKKLKKEVKLNG